MNDAQLVHLATRGDRSAFEAIVERYQSLVCAVTYGTTGDYAASEDLAQETFVAAWQNLSRLDRPDRLRAWLCAVARHVSLAANRKRRREAERIKALQKEPTTTSANGETPCDAATVREEQTLVWQTVEKIPDAYRVPLILYYREGQSVQRVAEATGLSEAAVKQRLLRGRRMLKEEMESLVEHSLSGSRPGKKFTAGVMAALPPAIAVSVPVAQQATTPSDGMVAYVQQALGACGMKQAVLSAVAVFAVAGIAFIGATTVFGGPAGDGVAHISETASETPPPEEEPLTLAGLAELPEEPAPVEALESSPTSFSEKQDRAPVDLVPGRVIAPAGYPGTSIDESAVDTVMGTVFAPNREPLPNAKVWIARFGMQARDTHETMANESGRYELTVPPGQWMVSARLGRLGGELDIEPYGQIITNGEKKRILANIRTEERCIVHGCVYEETTRKPISHPRIWTAGRFMVEGDAKGRYEIEGQARDYQTLAVLCPGYKRSYVIYSTLLHDDFELDLSVEPGVRVTGRVVDKEGRGLAHAWVNASGSGHGVLSAYYEVCDEYGCFTYDGLPAGREITMEAEQPHYVNTCWEPQPVEGTETVRRKLVTSAKRGDKAEITFTLDPTEKEEVRAINHWPDDPPPGVVRGRLVTWDGQPVRNFRIVTRNLTRDAGLPTPNGMEINEFSRGYSFTNDDGVFTLASPRLEAGTYLQLVATVDGYKDAIAEPVLVYGLENLSHVPETILRLGMPKKLKVRVTQAGAPNTPIQGAKVVMQDISEHWLKQPFDWRRMGSSMWRPVSATTDASGYAAFDDIIHERGIVLVTHPGYGRVRTMWQGTEQKIELAMELAAAVEGLVVDDKGGPPPNLAIRLLWCPEPPFNHEDFARSSETWWDTSPGHDGHFRFDQLPPGYYMLKSTYWPNRKYDHTDAVRCNMEFFLEPGQTIDVRLPEDSIENNPDTWVTSGGPDASDQQLAARLLGGWENRYTLPDLGMQLQIVMVFYADGRYEQSLFGSGAEAATQDSGHYRIIGGTLERSTDDGGLLTETVEFEGEGYYLRMAGDPFPDHPARGPFKPIDDVEKSLRRGEFLFRSRQPVRRAPQNRTETSRVGGRAGYSR